jgi:hypothetical protein
MDALPRTDINAAFTRNTFGLVDMNELLGFDGLS